ncbi:MAG: nuclear transport factor 2 family protein [Spongiibacteraceae bacterium]|jgi:hypothetical protein|nr:nuclear transport factor 2 family protein [Spongiibacteraceae bacterium]
MEKDTTALQETVARLEQRLGLVEDELAIRKLQFAYGYYLDKCLYEEVVDLFADDGEVWFFRGIFRGKEGVRRLYIGRFQQTFTGGKNGPVYGFLLDHPQLQDIIHVAPDGKTAKARARSMMQAGLHESAGGNTRQWWEGGIYENEYVKEDGVWKIKRLYYRPVFHADFDKGWAYTKPNYVPFYSEKDLYPGNPAGPDAIDPDPVLWPDTDVIPFHYPHPVTGKPWQG